MLPDPQTAVDIMGIAHVLASGLFNVPMGLSGAVSCTYMRFVIVMLKDTHYGKSDWRATRGFALMVLVGSHVSALGMTTFVGAVHAAEEVQPPRVGCQLINPVSHPVQVSARVATSWVRAMRCGQLVNPMTYPKTLYHTLYRSARALPTSLARGTRCGRAARRARARCWWSPSCSSSRRACWQSGMFTVRG